MTTNGTTLNRLPDEMFQGHIDKLNVSLHSLDRQRYAEITGSDRLEQVLGGLEKMEDFGIVKVVMMMPLKI